VPEDAGVAVALREILPVTVELLAGAVQATVGSPAACALLESTNPAPRDTAITIKAREILMG
jgi:hypothetical protein